MALGEVLTQHKEFIQFNLSNSWNMEYALFGKSLPTAS